MIARNLSALFVALLIATSAASGQSPMPVLVPAAGVTTVVPARSIPNAGAESGNAAALKELESLKAANAKLLEQQAATLLQLDEMAKNAEQLRIYTRRS